MPNYTTTDGVATSTTVADKMVAAIEAALLTGAAVVAVRVAGISTQYNRGQAITELNYWRRRQAVENGTRPRAARIVMN